MSLTAPDLPNVDVSEGTFKLSDGLEVYTKTYTPKTQPRAQLVFLHGFSDHSNTYTHFPPLTASHSLLVHLFDQRGWGRTSPSKPAWGATGPTSKILSDVDAVLSARLAAHPTLPLFLVGHSMGGGIALTYAYSGAHRDKLAGCIVWSPFIAFAKESQASGILIAAGRLAAKIAPGAKMVNKLNPAFMSRDPAVNVAFSNDPMCHDTGTLQCITQMLERARILREDGASLTWPSGLRVLVLHGSGDKVASFADSKRFVADGLKGVRNKEFREYEGWYHKMHAEPGEDKKRFADDLSEWVLKQVVEMEEGGGAAAKL